MASSKKQGKKKFVVWPDGSKTAVEAEDGKFLVLADGIRVRRGNPDIRMISEEKPAGKKKEG